MKFEASDLGNGSLGPLIDINIAMTDPELTLNGFALVDSGADNTVVPIETLVPFGVKWEDLSPAQSDSQGIGGESETRVINGIMSHRGTVFLKGDIQVLEAGGGLPGPLLGRGDFFNTFRVDFEWHKNPPIFHVKEPKRRPNKK